MPGWKSLQAGTKIGERNISNLRYADDTTLMAESEEKLKSLLRRVKAESENDGLKLIIKYTNIMALTIQTFVSKVMFLLLNML